MLKLRNLKLLKEKMKWNYFQIEVVFNQSNHHHRPFKLTRSK